MFWRFGGYANISTLDTILEKPDLALEELLDESDLIQELKQHNTKLIEYLRDDKILRRLLEYVIAPKPSKPPKQGKAEGTDDSEDEENGGSESETEKDEKARLKYAYVSCEILSSEAWSLLEALMGNISDLRMFWTFLDRQPPLDPLQASYFMKVNETLLDKKTDEMMTFVRSLDRIVPKILKHVDCPMIMDLLLKIISMEKMEGGAGIVDWLHSQDLIPMLLSFLSPEHPPTTQTASGDFIKALITISANASQNEQSCIGPNDLTRQLVSESCIRALITDMLKGGNPLTVGVGIVIEVIRKNNSDYDPDIGTGVDSIPSSRDPIYLGTLLRLFASHVPDFMKLILSQGVTITNEDGTKTEKDRELKVAFGGTIEPLGFDRFKTCELMAELLHCSNMGLLNEKGGERYVKERDRERDRLKVERLREQMEAGEMHEPGLGAAEEVVVEKAPLQVQNGGIEFSDDGMNEDEFEDVTASGDIDEARNKEQETKAKASETAAEEGEKKVMEEDLFVDEPLSPPTAATEPSAAVASATSTPDTPVPAPIPADEIPPLDKAPSDMKEEKPEPSTAPVNKEAVETPQEKKDTEMGEAQPSPKDEGNETPTKELVKEDESTSKDSGLATPPRAPSPPAIEDDNETLRSGGRSLVANLKAGASPAPLSPQHPSQEKAEDEPRLPTEDEQAQPEQPGTELPDMEENLMDLSTSPNASYADIDTLGSFGSSFTEYQTMIEPDVDGNPVVGDYLKMMFVEHGVVPTILDFFFRFPWNNFLHNVVYDVVQQVFNGPMDRGYNRALAIDLFVTGRITERIVEGQKKSDQYEAEKKMRLGYMGHLTLVAEEVVKFAERHPPEVLGQKVLEKVSDPVWIEYVEVTLAATRERDNAILGGVRPDMNLGPRMSAAQAQAFNSNSSNGGMMGGGGGLDSIDLVNGHSAAGNPGGAGGLLSGFGSSSDEEDDDMDHDDEEDEVSRLSMTGNSDQFATYISQEITNVDKFGSSDEDEDEDEEEDDMGFATAPTEPPPPPPPVGPLNIKGKKVGKGEDDSSDEEDEKLLVRTHEAKKREAIEDDDDDELEVAVRGLNINKSGDEEEEEGRANEKSEHGEGAGMDLDEKQVGDAMAKASGRTEEVPASQEKKESEPDAEAIKDPFADDAQEEKEEGGKVEEGKKEGE